MLWGDDLQTGLGRSLALVGTPAEAELIVPPGRRATVAGRALSPVEAISILATAPADSVAEQPPSIGAYCLAGKLALDLIIRERVAPRVVREGGGPEARWAAALAGAEDSARVSALARGMPPSAHAVPAGERGTDVLAPEVVLRAFLDAAVDALLRAGAQGTPAAGRPRRGAAAQVPLPWEQRWVDALRAEGARFEPQGFGERGLIEELAAWVDPALGARDRLRACFRLEVPEGEDGAFRVRFLLQSPDDPSLLVEARDVWRAKGRSLAALGRAFREPQESLLKALGLASRLFPPLGESLGEARPEGVRLDPGAAWRFLCEGAPALSQGGFGVIVPQELTAAGQRRLRLRLRVGSPSRARVAGVVQSAARLGLDEALEFGWEAALGDEALSARDLAALARLKAPLVRWRGEWVAVDPEELAEIRRRIAGGGGRITAREALRGALAGEADRDGSQVAVSAAGGFAEILERLRGAAGGGRAEGAPRALRGTLRPYQERGVAWLRTMAGLGLGGCLADDMGLGKTVQLLAYLLARLEEAPRDARPALLVAPTSVLGNWEREAARFAPDLALVRHYGAERARRAEEIPRRAGTLVITSYGLLRRDADVLAQVEWGAVALDEAQNIKNSASATARAARALRSEQRFALTGTPVENRLAELWSILEFASPGVLGPLATFRREYAIPIERYGTREAAERLRRLVGPFVLRRVKSDPAIIQDLPAKHEAKVFCTLTREQATLYQAALDETMRRIEEAEGIARRGLVLALLTALKQICNHPAQYLGEAGPLPRRSGKLARLSEMLEEALAAGDKALVFTQYREMGEALTAHLRAALGGEPLFLHGGTPKRTRDKMVRRFQEEPRGPRVFVLSLKAGGTGLNLTAASHVFHYDRWWNPAVEDQATDRAYRIGQTRAVQVHKLICAGTVEEKVDRLLEAKRDLAAKVVGAGEQWITELGDEELRSLVSLSRDAVVGAEDDEDEESAATAPRATARSQARARARREEEARR